MSLVDEHLVLNREFVFLTCYFVWNIQKVLHTLWIGVFYYLSRQKLILVLDPTFMTILSLITIWCLRYLQVRSHEIKNGTPNMVIPFALLSSLAYILSFAQKYEVSHPMGTSWKSYYDDDDDYYYCYAT